MWKVFKVDFPEAQGDTEKWVIYPNPIKQPTMCMQLRYRGNVGYVNPDLGRDISYRVSPFRFFTTVTPTRKFVYPNFAANMAKTFPLWDDPTLKRYISYIEKNKDVADNIIDSYAFTSFVSKFKKEPAVYKANIEGQTGAGQWVIYLHKDSNPGLCIQLRYGGDSGIIAPYLSRDISDKVSIFDFFTTVTPDGVFVYPEFVNSFAEDLEKYDLTLKRYIQYVEKNKSIAYNIRDPENFKEFVRQFKQPLSLFALAARHTTLQQVLDTTTEPYLISLYKTVTNQ